MRSYRFVIQLILVSLFFLTLAACASKIETTVTPTGSAPPAETTTISTVTTPAAATAEASPLPEPSLTAVTTATVATTEAATAAPVLALPPTPVPTPVVTLPAGLPVIAPENAAGLTQLARFGKGRIAAIDWSADGATFAVVGPARIYLYDAATLQEVGNYDARGEDAISGARLSPQGDVLALSRCNVMACFVELWQSASGQLIRTLADVDLPVFTPDGQTIIFLQSVGSETLQLVWQDVHTGETQRTLQLEFQKNAWVILSPGGEMLVEAGGRVRLWDTASGQLRHTFEATPPTAVPIEFERVAFSPQGDLLATSFVNLNSLFPLMSIVQLWDVKSGELLHVLEVEGGLQGFSPDGRLLAIGSVDSGTVQLWDTASGRLRHVLTNNNGYSLAFSPDGRQLAVVSGSRVLFYDTETGQLLRALAGFNNIMGVAFTPDGHSLIAAGGDEAQTWDVPSGQLRQTQASDIHISSMALSPDGSLMAWGGGKVQMWDVATGQLLYTRQEQGAVQVLFSPDGQLLAILDFNLGVKLRQASSGELLFSKPATISGQAATNVVFHPRDRLFAIGLGNIYAERDVGLRLWDMDTFELARSVEGLQHPVIFTADGHIVASDHTGSRGIWDIDTGDLLLPFTGGDAVTWYDAKVAALSPDGRILAVRNDLDALELWDMSTGHFLWASDSVTSVAFSPDGRLLATGNGDGTLSLWGLNPSLPASGACLNDSEFVLDVNVPDGTHLAAGAAFTKTWRLRNNGSCTWDASYGLDHVSGERMDGPESMSDGTSAIGQTVLPGAEVDISVALTAPQADGTYHGRWQLVAPDGTAFGARPYVEIVVP